MAGEMVEYECENGHVAEQEEGAGPPPLACLIAGCGSSDWTRVEGDDGS